MGEVGLSHSCVAVEEQAAWMLTEMVNKIPGLVHCVLGCLQCAEACGRVCDILWIILQGKVFKVLCFKYFPDIGLCIQ